LKCDGCDSKCCKKFIKFITIFDVARIVKELKIDVLDFLDLRPAYEIHSNYPRVIIKGEPYLLGLDNKMGRADCVFLMDIGMSRKCGIYSVRPLGCRTYPYLLSSDGETLKLTSEFICPRQYWPEGKEKEQYLALFQKQRTEKNDYELIVDEWNMMHSEDGNFLKFIDFALRKVEELDYVAQITQIS
jgi:Fe-S-cluster containining protein